MARSRGLGASRNTVSAGTSCSRRWPSSHTASTSDRHSGENTYIDNATIVRISSEHSGEKVTLIPNGGTKSILKHILFLHNSALSLNNSP